MANLDNIIENSEKETTRFDRFGEKYKDFVQKHRILAFSKNLVVAGTSFMIGGYLGAKAAKYGTDSKAIISGVSVLSQYIAGFAAFLPLHAMDNYDVYKGEDNKFKYKELAKDTGKLMLSFGVLEIAYMIGRPALHYNFMNKGIEPGTASLYSDLICSPAYWILAIPMAKITGVIKKSKKKDSNLTSS